MITFGIGIAVGAAFSKFWIAVYDIIKSKLTSSGTASKAVAVASDVAKAVESADTTK